MEVGTCHDGLCDSPRTSRGHDVVWVIVDWLTKSGHFLVVRMTFTLEDFGRLYIREIVRLYGEFQVFATWDPKFMRPGSQVYDSFLVEFPASHGNKVDDEHCL